jgi:hypothetical protein
MSAPEKIDLYKIHKAEYAAPKKPVLIDTKPARYLTIDGWGEPGGPEFEDRIGALYGMAFTIKMTRKFAGREDYTVSKLEALWWAPPGVCMSAIKKDQWVWKIMIRTPDFIGEEDLAKARKALIEKGKTRSVEQVVIESMNEGRCVQMLHIGPYDQVSQTIALMQAHAKAQGLELAGKHHEIYLSDPRRVAPEKLKTILRNPVKPGA